MQRTAVTTRRPILRHSPHTTSRSLCCSFQVETHTWDWHEVVHRETIMRELVNGKGSGDGFKAARMDGRGGRGDFWATRRYQGGDLEPDFSPILASLRKLSTRDVRLYRALGVDAGALMGLVGT